jgi:hypothetical protein
MLQIPALPFTQESRQSLLDEWSSLVNQLQKLRREIEQEGETEELLYQEDWLIAQVLTHRELYAEQTPSHPLSRCPFTGIELHLSIDTFGLDGPWWDFDDPVRQGTIFPETTFALTGAIELHSKIEFTRHIVYPGPGAPYVIPRLLAGDDTAAVLSSLPIGRHHGFAITYFGYPPHPERPIVDEWGRQGWTILRGRSPGWDTYPPVSEECDFELAPWLEQGKLLWIEPDDSTLTLQQGAEDCPYLNLKGKRTLQTLYEGGLS